MFHILKTAPSIIKDNIIKEQFKKKDFILVQGDINEYLYFIESGKVEVVAMSQKGQTNSITTFRAGESIGVLEIFNNDQHTQNVIVIEDCTIKKLHITHVLAWMKQDFDFTLYIIKLLEECFYNTSIFARNILSMTVKERTIVSLYKHYTNNTLSSLTKKELIQEAGTQKRSLNRIIEELATSGIITYEDKRFEVTNSILLTKKAKALL